MPDGGFGCWNWTQVERKSFASTFAGVKKIKMFLSLLLVFLLILPVLSKLLMKEKTRSVLVFGRGDDEDFELKGYDIAARSVAALPDTLI